MPQSLRATVSHASPSCSSVWPRSVIWRLDVVGVEQGGQGERLSIEIAGGTRSFQQHPDMAVVQHHRCVEPRLRVAGGVGEQCVVGVHELQPVASVGQQPLQRRGARPQRRRAEHERLLLGLLVLVEQHDHQPGPAAEAAEQRALADAGGGRDVVRGDRVGAALGDQAARSVQQ